MIEETKALAPWAESLPTGWRVARLDDVADVLFSNVDKHTVDGEAPVRLCNYVDVYNNERITGVIEFMKATAEEREIRKFQIRPGDVLATKDSEASDDIAIASLIAEDLPDVLCGYHLAMIRPRSKSVHVSFIRWAHASKQFRAQYEAKAFGVTRFGLSQYAFRAARLPLPPFPEQERIAAYLDAVVRRWTRRSPPNAANSISSTRCETLHFMQRLHIAIGRTSESRMSSSRSAAASRPMAVQPAILMKEFLFSEARTCISTV